MEIVNPEIESYIRKLLPERKGVLAAMELVAEEKNIPIVKPEVAQLLHFMVKLHKSKRVLEIGTAIGYSTLWLAYGMTSERKEETNSEELELISIEKDPVRFQEAEVSLKGEGLPFVKLIHGDALDVLPSLRTGFDLIFVDAAKGQYLNFFDLSLPLLKADGLIITDNVLFRGFVAAEEIDKRYRTLVRKIKEYLSMISTHPELETTVLPIGDGVALSYKKR